SSHAHAIEASVKDGVVTLSGPILADEALALIKAVQRMSGVKETIDRLQRHSEKEAIPALQGGRKRVGERPEILQRVWTPSLRLAACAAGVSLIGTSLARKRLVSLPSLIGGALVARSLANRPLKALLGFDSTDPGFEVQKSLSIHAPRAR